MNNHKGTGQPLYPYLLIKLKLSKSGLTQKFSQTLIPLFPLRSLRFVFWSFCVSPISKRN